MDAFSANLGQPRIWYSERMKLSRHALIFLLIALVVTVCIIAILYFLPNGFFRSSSSSVVSTHPSGPITTEGMMVCLPYRDQSGPHTDECAFGLRDDGGHYFALSDSDSHYANLTSVPMNERVEVTGIFTARTDSKYQDIGVITVERLTNIDAGSTAAQGGQGIAVYTSGVRGEVALGPTCPLIHDPPDPACADKPYATLVSIYRQSDTAHAFASTRSDEAGNFKVSLPPGEYVVGAGESMLPRCGEVSVTVSPEGYATTTISCDTGIR
jgi:hypothetical protein